MTTDERLDKLTERHEALTMNVELLLRGIREDSESIRALIREDSENIRALARIAEIHERRLTHLEGGEV